MGVRAGWKVVLSLRFADGVDLIITIGGNWKRQQTKRTQPEVDIMWIFSSSSSSSFLSFYRRRGRVSKGVGHLAHVWSRGVRKVVSSNPDRGNIVGWVFHPTRWLARFSLIWICLSFQILNLFRTLSSWWSGNYRPSAPFLYEVASHVK